MRWSEVDDLDGQEHYRVLGVTADASADDVKKAYRELIRGHHPDKGGDPEHFARIQRAFAVLSDDGQRQAYDRWAHEVQFRFVPQDPASNDAHSQVQSADSAHHNGTLVHQLGNMQLDFTSSAQLVVTCEMCRAPATKTCWICTMPICEGCTRRQHWKGEHRLHWPLVHCDHMRYRLALREFEQKRLEDARMLSLEDPNYRSEQQLRVARSFRDAALKMQDKPDKQTTYDVELAQYYMWCQTEASVHIAVHVPTGNADKALDVEVSTSCLAVRPEGSPPVVVRRLAHVLDATAPVLTHRSRDNRFVGITLSKAQHGAPWRRLFQGDSDGARCMQTPYKLHDLEDEVVMELQLPFWIDASDVAVKITDSDLTVAVRNQLYVRRTYWRNRVEEQRRGACPVVDLAGCSWSFDEASSYTASDTPNTTMDGSRRTAGRERPPKGLTVTLGRPPATPEEVLYKKGVRQSNRVAERHAGPPPLLGRRFFIDDEDEFGLEDMLQAMAFHECAVTFVPAKPWQLQASGRSVTKACELSGQARQHLRALGDGAAA